MANRITFTFFDESANNTNQYEFDFNNENYDRLIEAARWRFGTANAQSGLYEISSKNEARKGLTKESIRLWKEAGRNIEVVNATANVAANIPPIESTEI